MSMNYRSLCVGCAWAAPAMASVVIARGAGPVKSTEAPLAAGAVKGVARLDTFAKDGDTYFALSLSPTTPRPAAKPARRRDPLRYIGKSDRCLSRQGLGGARCDARRTGAGDKVRLYAVDLNTIPLIGTTSPRRWPELRAGVNAGASARAAGQSPTCRLRRGRPRPIPSPRRRARAVMRPCTSATASSTANPPQDALRLVERLAAQPCP